MKLSFNTKTDKLSLSNEVLEDNSEIMTIHKDPNNPICTVKLASHYFEKCLPPPDSKYALHASDALFWRAAYKCNLRKRKKEGFVFTAGLENNNRVG